MRATPDILNVWRKFDSFPMETITKAWYFQISSEKKQRTVDQMIAHREQYGTSGNCFDLAIWLIHEFRQVKLPSYAVLTPDSHVAVVAINGKGNRYLCDLGDQWIEPILIDRDSEEYTEEYLDHFFPGARVKLKSNDDISLFVKYRRPNGKEMDQTYLLKPISDEQLMIEAEKTQRTLRTPLVEMRIFAEREVIHWEFDDFISFYSSMEGKRMERALPTQTEWAERINKISGISTKIIMDAFEIYSKYH